MSQAQIAADAKAARERFQQTLNSMIASGDLMEHEADRLLKESRERETAIAAACAAKRTQQQAMLKDRLEARRAKAHADVEAREKADLARQMADMAARPEFQALDADRQEAARTQLRAEAKELHTRQVVSLCCSWRPCDLIAHPPTRSPACLRV